jgi:hypothetical protein
MRRIAMDVNQMDHAKACANPNQFRIGPVAWGGLNVNLMTTSINNAERSVPGD